MGTAGGAIRLVDGAWALPTAAGLWIGVLEGGFQDGWRSHLGLLDRAELPAVRHVLSGGGLASGPTVAVAADGEAAVLDVAGGRGVLLDPEAAARLQILCSLAPPADDAATPVRLDAATAGDLDVRASRAALEVDVPDDRLAGAVLDGLDVRAAGLVGLVLDPVDDSAAPPPLTLPALPVLLAAAEAARDDLGVELRLRQPDGIVLTSVLEADDALRVSADAQWLLPSLLRRAYSQPLRRSRQ